MTWVGLVEAGNLKRFSGTGSDHARAFASMAGSLDMIVPFRIFRSASDSRFGVSSRRRRCRYPSTTRHRGCWCSNSGRRGKGTAAARRKISGRHGAGGQTGLRWSRQSARHRRSARTQGRTNVKRAHVDVGRPTHLVLKRVEGSGTRRLDKRTRRGRGLDAHRPHPCPLRGGLGVGPGEVRSGREVLNVIVHVLARGQGHARIFHLAADRGQDTARRQRRPERHPATRGTSRRSHAGQPHCFHPPCRLRRSL
jgi:hypothetical protein